MTLLPILLFVLGVICLIWAMRMGNSSGKSSPEILTILQGLAGVKKEISQAQRSLREVESQLGDHELRLMRNENVQADLRTEVNAQKINISNLAAQPSPLTQEYSLQRGNRPQTTTPFCGVIEQPSKEELAPQVLPEKYQWVVELHQQGWSVADIAGHLAISRDAVNMVLRTASKGKGLER
ncbi:RNA polymerase sigma factor, sigma-70 family [Desulfitobacterium dichloroeliminans LMG P-21439]|uniref:RNA polymerase sigma factor, sigma-70 family n=1 Tax=Desulfitobacterium dichloroeliminans (strain LMG P-21439 / DCA1) TaxID=871963 RepID=L0F581_DESDL|nr:DNA-directed RNA polymerase sigma-70 factor [Desulfitobacterium dichloroeliminans]AGA68083.1 RNA polymerase sigma factor, sigma-70 family [Desulfitobacterium dichloroeliminans LMG P-21439]